MSKNKSSAKKRKRGEAEFEIQNTLTELQTIQKQANPKAPDFKPLFEVLNISEKLKYDKWENNMRSTYHSTYDMLAYMLVQPLNSRAIGNADYWYSTVMRALSFEVLCADICSNIDDYIDELVAAALDPQKKTIPKLSDPQYAYPYEPCRKNNDVIWYDMVFPDNMINYLFHTAEAEGLAVTEPSVNTIITQKLCNSSRLPAIAQITIEAYKAVTEKLCKSVDGATSLGNKVFDSMQLQGNIDKPAITPLDKAKMIPHGIVWFLEQSADKMLKTYKSAMPQDLLTEPETLIFGIASEAFGISSRSVLHYMMLRLSDCIISEKPEILYGVVNERDALPPIALRTLTSISIIQSKVEKQIAYRYSKIENLELQAEQKLTKANSEMKLAEQHQRNAEKEIIKAERETAALNAKIANLEAKLKDREAEIDSLTDALAKLDSEAVCEAATSAEPGEAQTESEDNLAAEPLDYPVRTVRGFKVMVYGGHETWAGPMSQRFPDVTFRYGRGSYTCDGIRTQTLIIFQTNAISHGASIPVKNEAQRASVPILNFLTAGVDTCSRQLYDILKKNHALLKEEGNS